MVDLDFWPEGRHWCHLEGPRWQRAHWDVRRACAFPCNNQLLPMHEIGHLRRLFFKVRELSLERLAPHLAHVVECCPDARRLLDRPHQIGPLDHPWTTRPDRTTGPPPDRIAGPDQGTRQRTQGGKTQNPSKKTKKPRENHGRNQRHNESMGEIRNTTPIRQWRTQRTHTRKT